MSLTTVHDIAVALRTYLRTQNCPLDVVDGPEQPTTTWGRERIVIEHDVDGSDSFSNPHGLHTNAKHRHTATDAYKLTIYTQSKVPGAKPFEHRSRAKLVRETVVAGLDYVAATNKNRWSPSSGAFVTPPDLALSEQPGGAAYELKFTYDLPIRVVTFAGEARPEGTLTGLRSTTSVTRFGDDETPEETACGA